MAPVQSNKPVYAMVPRDRLTALIGSLPAFDAAVLTALLAKQRLVFDRQIRDAAFEFGGKAINRKTFEIEGTRRILRQANVHAALANKTYDPSKRERHRNEARNLFNRGRLRLLDFDTNVADAGSAAYRDHYEEQRSGARPPFLEFDISGTSILRGAGIPNTGPNHERLAVALDRLCRPFKVNGRYRLPLILGWERLSGTSLRLRLCGNWIVGDGVPYVRVLLPLPMPKRAGSAVQTLYLLLHVKGVLNQSGDRKMTRRTSTLLATLFKELRIPASKRSNAMRALHRAIADVRSHLQGVWYQDIEAEFAIIDGSDRVRFRRVALRDEPDHPHREAVLESQYGDDEPATLLRSRQYVAAEP